MAMSKWVNHWGKLANLSLRETGGQALSWLRQAGYADSGGRPTQAAIRRGLARFDGTVVQWNLVRYVSIRRDERRAERRAKVKGD
jgi:hypothetical protein